MWGMQVSQQWIIEPTIFRDTEVAGHCRVSGPGGRVFSRRPQHHDPYDTLRGLCRPGNNSNLTDYRLRIRFSSIFSGPKTCFVTRVS